MALTRLQVRAKQHNSDYAYCFVIVTCTEHVHYIVPQSWSVPGQITGTGEEHTAQPHPPVLPSESCFLNK